MDLDTFRQRFPEFDQASDRLVNGALAEAAGQTSAEAWGENYDTAHALLTADILWLSPFGASMRRVDDTKQNEPVASPYAQRLADARRRLVIPMLVT